MDVPNWVGVRGTLPQARDISQNPPHPASSYTNPTWEHAPLNPQTDTLGQPPPSFLPSWCTTPSELQVGSHEIAHQSAAPPEHLSSTMSGPTSPGSTLQLSSPEDICPICPRPFALSDASGSLHAPVKSHLAPGAARDGPFLSANRSKAPVLLSSVMNEWVSGARNLEEENMRLSNELQRAREINNELRAQAKLNENTAAQQAQQHAELMAQNDLTQARLREERKMYWAEGNRVRNEYGALRKQAAALKTSLSRRTAELASWGAELTLIKGLNLHLTCRMSELTELMDVGKRNESEHTVSIDSITQVKQEFDSADLLSEQVELQCQPDPPNASIRLTARPVSLSRLSSERRSCKRSREEYDAAEGDDLL
ncbi:hypothetical protein R3P38DRAFT_3202845 [Favolaschia claudopus]|uniref:Uncharacterized protein n=1 Tax=Favolaschia claudopus TaxID=2862362 RepID=A0AAW0AUG7_9AGAR